MKTSIITIAVIAAVVLIFGLSIMGSYNGMVTQSTSVDTSWAQVESQYQRRFDLIPNLVNATKGFLKQEQTVYKDIADARTHYAGTASGSTARVDATNQMEGALSRLLVVMENYPELKSNQTVQALMDELAGTENRVVVARDRYNVSVQTYNTSIKSFPTNIMAGMFGFTARPFFKSQEGADKAPTVNLDLTK